MDNVETLPGAEVDTLYGVYAVRGNPTRQGGFVHMNVGQRVALASPTGELRRGSELGALIVVLNGSLGVVVGSGAPTTLAHPRVASVVVAFDDIGQTVGVSVPQHWLAPAP